ncbi:putative heme A:farnesyltransferase [Heterostelium album PN500]|uniref:Protoheme IX farnesyltransferase, mitochondrial n=1 Tax=Heterostelium pallidum (strain ATCC 26659 / Pp 5 / PN500) TaxID=670386 RepID=D3BIZ2_HETP5|nr:putative heme A:farnesyltransferase [Heterostelium album PN500]EFA78766.1 putative heme A:farnesyltransferase [Heterostelium album PN500]|eukprot:XP_020430890.1 putative heme A:farnesyltransferase [Heterostelium album PN500]
MKTRAFQYLRTAVVLYLGGILIVNSMRIIMVWFLYWVTFSVSEPMSMVMLAFLCILFRPYSRNPIFSSSNLDSMSLVELTRSLAEISSQQLDPMALVNYFDAKTYDPKNCIIIDYPGNSPSALGKNNTNNNNIVLKIIKTMISSKLFSSMTMKTNLLNKSVLTTPAATSLLSCSITSSSNRQSYSNRTATKTIASYTSLFNNSNGNACKSLVIRDHNIIKNRLPLLFHYCTSTTVTSTSTTNATAAEIILDNQPQQQQQQQTQQQQEKEKPKVVSKFGFMRKGYFNLVKFPISVYVTFTAVAGYVMTVPVVDPLTLGVVSFGTFMASASACAHNQEMEVNYDSKMPRTKTRPLITGEIKRDTGFLFALATGVIGCGSLILVHPMCGALAMSNIFIYIYYTHLKRTTSFNTWVGAIVGAIPPLIGTVAGAREIEAIGGLLATVLFIWQIPHFLALAEKLKSQYAAAGYRMLPVTHPTWNFPVSLAHAVAGVIAPLAIYYTFDPNITLFTTLAFSASSFIMGLESVLEHRYQQKIAEAAANGIKLPPQSRKRGVFFLSLIMLPLSLIIGMLFRLPYEYFYETQDKQGQTKEESIYYDQYGRDIQVTSPLMLFSLSASGKILFYF